MGIRTQRSYRGQTAAAGYTTEYYTDGNTARSLKPEHRRKRVPIEEQRRIVQRSREAERTKSVSMNLPLTLLLIAAVAAVLAMGYDYLCLKSSIDTHMDNVKTLETRLENLRSENDSLERSIDTSIDLNYVYDVAVNELGMVHAGRDNVIRYDKTESEYVRQYEDIPAAE